MLVGVEEPIFLMTHVQMFEVASSCVCDNVSMEGVGESATIVLKDTIQYLQQNAIFFLFQEKTRMTATMPKKSHGNYELYPIHLDWTFYELEG